jgi:UDP-N-acetylglucosamine--N-acetylmuramyl-(pentapeptide) pyrophosphoryl-undecaprenol N-acetylglucosamine transferase
MKILITGAHFTPAQAVIEELKKVKDIELVYIGRGSTREGDKTPSIESQVLPDLGVKFYSIIAGRLRREFSLATLISFFKIPIGFIQSFWIVLKEHPRLVLSFGGYVSVPVVFSAWLLNIPIIIHEQTLVTGLANHISSLFADKIAVSFDKEYEFKKEKIVLTGNPIRKELLIDTQPKDKKLEQFIKDSQKEGLPLIYITGGNQGSHIINETILKSLERLVKMAFIIHQTGDSKYNDFDQLVNQSKDLKNGDRYLAFKWVKVEDLNFIYRKVDLVVSRGGANTLSELSYFGLPTLVIPIPFAIKNEQLVNAKYFKDRGLAQILLQKDLTENKLVDDITKLLQNLTGLKRQAKNAQSLIIEDASQRLALETLLLKDNS